ncbi:MAG: TRAP transporter substrate-binding protein [Chloroflexi bacterium]|nr:TRAP transporter substrate-binding protein [Chloroflexota bacterium]
MLASLPRALALAPVILALLLAVACAPAAPAGPPAKPAAEAPKPAAAPEPAKPAAQPAKPAAEAPKPAAQPAKPAAQAPKPAAQVIELRAGASNPKADVMSDAIDKFADLVNQKSKGEITVRVFYQSLGVEHQLAQAVMTGSVDFGQISNGNAARFTNAWLVYDLPFLFKSHEITLKSLEKPAGRKAIEGFEKDMGLKWLFPIAQGNRDIETRSKPLKVPADMRGLKIRVISSPVDLSTFKAWGANPTPVDWGQTYAALQQGVVEGVNVPILILHGAKLYEVTKHVIRLDYQAVFGNFFMNAKKLQSLSPAHQKIILEAAQEAGAWNLKDALSRIDKAQQELIQKYGLQVYTPTPAEYQQWASIREKVWQEVGEQLKEKLDMNLAKQLYESQ